MRKQNSQALAPLLILGGTDEAYMLAQDLTKRGGDIIYSLAGRTQNPRLPDCPIKLGGYGGVAGMQAFIHQHKIGAIIDATHPFAYQISHNAQLASQQTAISYLRYERPSWQKTPADNWQVKSTLEDIATELPHQCRCFLALGRQHIQPFARRDDVMFIARMIEPSQYLKDFKHIEVVLAKPGDLAQEKQFLIDKSIDVMVCRNGGSQKSYTKIIAARELNIAVYLIDRQTTNTSASFANIDDILSALYQQNFLQWA